MFWLWRSREAKRELVEDLYLKKFRLYEILRRRKDIGVNESFAFHTILARGARTQSSKGVDFGLGQHDVERERITRHPTQSSDASVGQGFLTR